jgi:DeoR/GlpR family transcriptional regulator of sugar metabolism
LSVVKHDAVTAAWALPTSPVLPAVRRRYALRVLNTRGYVTCREIQTTFEISEATARRDIDALVSDGRASRIHGGAMLPEYSAPHRSN